MILKKVQNKKDTIQEHDSRSEEVSDIIERMPTGWTHIVVVIMTLIIAVMVTLGFIIKYPDTVRGEISITGEKAPVRLIAATSGRLHLLVANNTEVKKGTCIGYMDNGFVYADVMILDSLCNIQLGTDTKLKFPKQLELGALGAYYNDFVLAYVRYDQLRTTSVYENMRKTLRNQQKSDKSVSENLKKEISLNNVALANMVNRYEADSILHEVGALSGESLVQQHNNILVSQQSNLELKSSELQKQSDINSVNIELAKVDVSYREEYVSSYNEMVARYNVLKNQIRQWKELYLFIAPINGNLQYMGFWRNNVFIEARREMFSILPSKNRMIGELLMPSSGAGKVKIGQDVNVKLLDYPYDEYGYIRGKVETISSLAHNAESNEGLVNLYLVTVSFPKGLKTNFGKELHINYESSGIGDIITEHRRLIHRLFDNLKAKETK